MQKRVEMATEVDNLHSLKIKHDIRYPGNYLEQGYRLKSSLP